MCEEYYSTFVPFFVITEIPQVFFKIQNWAGSKNSLVHPELRVGISEKFQKMSKSRGLLMREWRSVLNFPPYPSGDPKVHPASLISNPEDYHQHFLKIISEM